MNNIKHYELIVFLTPINSENTKTSLHRWITRVFLPLNV